MMTSVAGREWSLTHDGAPSGDVDFSHVITGAPELFVLDPTVAHLNHGSFGAVPTPVREARQRLLAEYDANPMRFVTGDLQSRVAAAREDFARFLGADPATCALVVNATSGTALVLNSLDLRGGDEIIVTDHSYNAVAQTIDDLVARVGVRKIVAPVDLGATTDETVASVTGRVTERTRLVIVDEVSSATAQRHPVSRLATALRARNVPFLVDAAHTPGMLPRPLTATDPDFWVGNLHKWAFAPSGTALFRASPTWHDKLVPLVVSHAHQSGFPRNVEQQGTRDHTTWLTARVGLTIFERFGEAEIQRHNAELAAYGQRVIGEALDIEPALLPDPGHGVSMRVIPLPDGLASNEADAAALRTRISAELATEVAVNVWRGGGLLRISAQVYNTEAEYDRLAAGLPALLAKVRSERSG